MVQPVGAPKIVTHGIGGLYILDAEGYDGNSLFECLIDFVKDVLGDVRAHGPNQDKYLAGIDGFNNGFCKVLPRQDVPWSDPAADF